MREYIEDELGALLRLHHVKIVSFVSYDLLADDPVQDGERVLDIKIRPFLTPLLQVVNIGDLLQDIEITIKLLHHALLPHGLCV